MGIGWVMSRGWVCSQARVSGFEKVGTESAGEQAEQALLCVEQEQASPSDKVARKHSKQRQAFLKQAGNRRRGAERRRG